MQERAGENWSGETPSAGDDVPSAEAGGVVADDGVAGGGPDGSGGDGSGGRRRKARRQWSLWVELPFLVVVALVLALLIKTFLVQAFVIPSGSMQNTLGIGDRVLVDKFTPHLGDKPSRGQVVVFHDPDNWLAGEEVPSRSSNGFLRGVQDVLGWVGLMPSPNEHDLIKRVIAVGGDTVSCQGTGPVYVNGKPLDEPYLFPGATPCGDRNFGPLKVPADSIWVMGDHRNMSSDSRYHMDEPGGGAVPDKDVIGRAVLVVWPISHWKTLPIPATFHQAGITDQSAAGAAAALVNAPGALGLLGVVPLTLRQRRRRAERDAAAR